MKIKLLLREIFIYSSLLLIIPFFSTTNKYQKIYYNRLISIYNIENKKLNQFHEFIKEVPDFKNKSYYFNNVLFYHNKYYDIYHYLKLNTKTFVSQANNYYVTYKKAGEKINFFNKKGNLLWSYNTRNYPFLSPSGNRIILLNSDGSSISVIDKNINMLLTNVFISTLITDLKFCDFDDSFVIGTIEGNVISYNHQNQLNFKYKAPKSNKPLIKSIILSERSRYIGVCSGINPEYVFVLRKDGKLLWKTKTKENNRKIINLLINKKEKKLIRKEGDYLIIHHLLSGKVIEKIFINTEGLGVHDYTLYTLENNKILVLINGSNLRKAFVITTKGQILFEKIFYDSYFVRGEIKNNFITIYTSENIFLYSLYN